MKFIFVSLFLLGSAAGVFGLISLRGDSTATGAMLPIDDQMPERIETATFALG
jgi:hypothetical protein